MLKEASFELRNKVESTLAENGIEFRRGLSGGGNQLRQPYFKKNYNINYDDFKNTDHVHHFSWYVGNYPTLEREKIDTLINILNAI
jgi:CDP-6-deoxy-D-xylo-4-hexulose-3-dehydrase